MSLNPQLVAKLAPGVGIQDVQKLNASDNNLQTVRSLNRRVDFAVCLVGTETAGLRALAVVKKPSAKADDWIKATVTFHVIIAVTTAVN